MNKRLKVRADVGYLMTEAAKEIKVPAFAFGFAIAVSALNKIAERAIKLNDPVLLDACHTMFLVEMSDKELEENNKKVEQQKIIDNEENYVCPRCHKRNTAHLEDRLFECHDCGETYPGK